MLDAVNLLRRKQVQFDVATQRVLQTWKSEDLSQVKCPTCQQAVLPTPYMKQEKPVYYCLRCNSYAGIIHHHQICHCQIPGEGTNCQGCPNFERFMMLVRAQVAALEHLSLETLLHLQASGTDLGQEC